MSKRQRSRLEVSRTAVKLFWERGPAGTSGNDIAAFRLVSETVAPAAVQESTAERHAYPAGEIPGRDTQAAESLVRHAARA
ncbi:hypothetical protein ACFO4E_11125 [Nocardiopsis mangrovi]|uniref:Uncharacterized protein n=1 Tax=Nocardiopsis mangrovi TaxID=1179818 RepID=A0ABV9DVK1_9ACTN